MAEKTSLQVTSFNPTTSKNVTKTATYSNPNATNAQLNSFAQKMYGSAGLSANTVNSVIRVDKTRITNAEPDAEPEPTGTYALWTPSAEFYDINNDVFKQVMCNDGERLDSASSVSTIDNIYVLNDDIMVDFTRQNGNTETAEFDIESLLGRIDLTMTSGTRVNNVVLPSN